MYQLIEDLLTSAKFDRLFDHIETIASSSELRYIPCDVEYELIPGKEAVYRQTDDSTTDRLTVKAIMVSYEEPCGVVCVHEDGFIHVVEGRTYEKTFVPNYRLITAPLSPDPKKTDN